MERRWRDPAGSTVSFSTLVRTSASADVHVVACQQVEQSRLVRDAQEPRQRRVCDVAVDQQHRMVEFHGHAHGQVQRGEGLALSGQRAGHHDQVLILALGASPSQRVADDRALDDAEFVGGLRRGHVRGHIAACSELAQIDLDSPVRRAHRRALRRRGLRCGHRGTGPDCGRRYFGVLRGVDLDWLRLRLHFQRANDRFRCWHPVRLVRLGNFARRRLVQGQYRRAAVPRGASPPARSGSSIAPHMARPMNWPSAKTAVNDTSKLPTAPANR